MNKRVKQLRDEALAIAKAAETEERKLTPEETVSLETLLGAIKVEKSVSELQAGFSPVGTGGNGLWAAAKAQGFDHDAGHRKVVVPFSALTKDPSFGGTDDELNPAGRRDGPALGYDRRRIYQIFPSEPVADDTTSVPTFRQSGRTLASPGDMQRDIDAVTDKPETDSALELVDLSLKQVASVQSAIPNILFRNDRVRSVVDQDLADAHADALDDLCLDAILAAAPSGGTGVDLIAQVRTGIEEMADQGYSADTIILSGSLAADLDLFRDGSTNETYLFAGSARSTDVAPLFGLRIVVSKLAALPILVATASAGTLFASPLRLESFDDNPKKNTSLVRIENNAGFGVERDEAFLIISAGS